MRKEENINEAFKDALLRAGITPTIDLQYPNAIDLLIEQCLGRSSPLLGRRGKKKPMRKTPTFDELHTPRPYSEWHEDYGPVLWYTMPIESPPHCGDPLCSDWPFDEEDEARLWWSPLPDGNLIQSRWEARKHKPCPACGGSSKDYMDTTRIQDCEVCHATGKAE